MCQCYLSTYNDYIFSYTNTFECTYIYTYIYNFILFILFVLSCAETHV